MPTTRIDFLPQTPSQILWGMVMTLMGIAKNWIQMLGLRVVVSWEIRARLHVLFDEVLIHVVCTFDAGDFSWASSRSVLNAFSNDKILNQLTTALVSLILRAPSSLLVFLSYQRGIRDGRRRR